MAGLIGSIKEVKQEQLLNLRHFKNAFIVFWTLRMIGFLSFLPLYFLYAKLSEVKASSRFTPMLKPLIIIMHRFGVGGISLLITLLFFICSLVYLIKIASILYYKHSHTF